MTCSLLLVGSLEYAGRQVEELNQLWPVYLGKRISEDSSPSENYWANPHNLLALALFFMYMSADIYIYLSAADPAQKSL